MTVQTTNIKTSHTGDGVTVTYTFNFTCLNTAWVRGFVNDVEVAIQNTVLNANQDSNPGGSTEFVLVPPSGFIIDVVRDVDFLQTTDYPAYTRFPAKKHEDALDKLTMLTQQIEAQNDGFQEAIDFNTAAVNLLEITKVDKNQAILSGDADTLDVTPGDLSGDVTVTPITNVANGLCQLGADGLVQSAQLPPAGAGDFMADGSVPMSGNLQMGDGADINLIYKGATNNYAWIMGPGISFHAVDASGFPIDAPMLSMDHQFGYNRLSINGESGFCLGTLDSGNLSAGGEIFLGNTTPSLDSSATSKLYVDSVAGGGDFMADGSVPMTGTLTSTLTEGRVISMDNFTVDVSGDEIAIGNFETGGIRSRYTIGSNNELYIKTYGVNNDGAEITLEYNETTINFGQTEGIVFRTKAGADGGLFVKNTLTGTGMERVLTTSDSGSGGGSNYFPGNDPNLVDINAALLSGSTDASTELHLEYGSSTIQAKADATTASKININPLGGDIVVGNANYNMEINDTGNGEIKFNYAGKLALIKRNPSTMRILGEEEETTLNISYYSSGVEKTAFEFSYDDFEFWHQIKSKAAGAPTEFWATDSGGTERIYAYFGSGANQSFEAYNGNVQARERVLTESDLGSFGSTTAPIVSAISKFNDSPSTIAPWNLSFEANSIYKIVVLCNISESGVGGGSIVATATGSSDVRGYGRSCKPTIGTSLSVAVTSGLTITQTVASTTGLGIVMHFDFTVETQGSAETLAFTFGQETTDSQPSVLLPGSYMTWEKIN